MNKYISILSLSVFYFSAVANAERDWPPGSASYAAQHHVKETSRYKEKTTKLMETIYFKLDNDYQSNAIKNQVKAWEQYIDSTCNVVGISSGAGGSWPSAYNAKCEQGLSYGRYFAAKNALKCIERVEHEKYALRMDKFNCVIQTLNVKVF